MATHLQAWTFTDKIGSVGALLVVLGMLYFALRITFGLLRKQRVREAPSVGPADATA
jgi:hypothetical protein